MHCRRFLLIVAALVWLAACSEPAPRLARLTDDAVILAFGDSLTYGTGAAREQSYPSILQQMSGRHVINAGNPGEVSRDGLTRLEEVLAQTQPDLVLLCHGGNDMLRQYDVNETKHNLRRMIELARQYNAQVVLLGVPKPKLFAMRAAPIYREVAEELKVPLQTDILPEVLGDSSLKSDTIHPNAKGYRLIGEAVHKLLQKSGAL